VLFATWEWSQLWTSPLEIFAVVTGLICVTLLTFENWSPKLTWWNWPVGILSAGAYVYIFWDYELYFNSALQIFYVATGFYGAWAWRRGGVDGGELTVRRITPLTVLAYTAGSIGMAGLLAVALFDVFGVDSASPFLDALVVTLSVSAQFIMTRKYLQHWLFWIAVDIIAVYLFWSQDLYLTSALYFVFGCLSTRGLFTWMTAHRKQIEPTPVPAPV